VGASKWRRIDFAHPALDAGFPDGWRAIMGRCMIAAMNGTMCVP
jgi:hypothetical protein